jgi:hypothetical protein
VYLHETGGFNSVRALALNMFNTCTRGALRLQLIAGLLDQPTCFQLKVPPQLALAAIEQTKRFSNGIQKLR